MIQRICACRGLWKPVNPRFILACVPEESIGAVTAVGRDPVCTDTVIQAGVIHAIVDVIFACISIESSSAGTEKAVNAIGTGPSVLAGVNCAIIDINLTIGTAVSGWALTCVAGVAIDTGPAVLAWRVEAIVALAQISRRVPDGCVTAKCAPVDALYSEHAGRL